jgi:Concanavalin A-like lectin/glucanases superfamily
VPNTAGIVIHDDDLAVPLAIQHPFEAVQAGSVLDGSGNARHAALLPAASGPSLVPGRVGMALQCDGVDDRARIADFGWGTSGEFSLAFWFRTADTAGTGTRYLVSHGAVAATNRLGIHFDQATGRLRTALVYANALSDLDVLDVTRELRDGQWHHYALVATTDQLVRVYIDGQAETAAQYLGDSIDPTGDFVLGARSDLSAGTFANATIDEFQLWPRPLSAVEVALLQQPLGAEAMVYPGAGADIRLATAVGGALSEGPRQDIKRALPGAAVSALFRSPGGSLDGGLGLLGGELFATGAPFSSPLLPWLHMAAPIVVGGPVVLAPSGGLWSITIPPGLAGASLMLQPAAIHPTLPNGGITLGDGHEIRF